MAETEKISGLTIKDELNTDLWRSDEIGLQEHIHNAFIHIVDGFIDQLNVDVEYKDVCIAGIHANYSWNKQADIDLYVVIDYEKYSDQLEWVHNLFNTKADLFNKTYDVEILDYDVSLHVVNDFDDINSESIFSLIDNSWVRKPDTKDRPTLNEDRIRKQIRYYKNFIERVDNIQDHNKRFRVANELKEKLLSMKAEDEFSENHIIYRSLYTSGVIKDLIDIIIDAYGETLSLKEQAQYHYNPNQIILF